MLTCKRRTERAAGAPFRELTGMEIDPQSGFCLPLLGQFSMPSHAVLGIYSRDTKAIYLMGGADWESYSKGVEKVTRR